LTRIAVAVTIDAPPDAVWTVVERVEDHTRWMTDAAGIRFEGDRRRGVGTQMVVATRVGPLRLSDRMEITEWVDRHVMGVRHSGLVTGTGRFTLEAVGETATRFAWTEELRFPWWMGGPVGGLIGGRVLAAVWRKNLRNLKQLVETGPATQNSAN
jgi:carbon monoxide dehydrogenase subunit G